MTDEEARVLAWTLLGEAAGEGDKGMTAVAHVIRNRSLSGRFPANPAAAALQQNSSGIHQFSTWNGLGQGGNAPRARFPVGSVEFNRALSVVNQVFSAAPGKDPTLGATHYYAPQGMAGGTPPYWWRSESPRGEVRIGNHVFAKKRDEAVAPVPATRVGDDIGQFPSGGQLQVLRTGGPAQLPVIGPTGGPSLRTPPKPAVMSKPLQIATMRLIADPVSGEVVPRLPTAAQVRRSIPQSQIERTAPARDIQRVAGFSVGGTGSIAQVDSVRRSAVLESQAPSFAGQDRAPVTARPRTQTTFAQPAGSVNPDKPQERLVTPTTLEPRLAIPSGGLSRDAIAARAAGVAAANALPVRQPPPAAVPRVQLPPVVVTPVQTAPLRIVPQGNPVADTIRAKPVSAVQALRDQGLSPSEAYATANSNARERAIAGSANPSGNTTRARLAAQFNFD